MNIFYLDHDPVVAAQMHCDVHSYKMISESVLMLCNAHRMLDGDSYADEVGMFPLGYQNHPCSKWVMRSAGNYNWLLVMVGHLSRAVLSTIWFKEKRASEAQACFFDSCTS